jgi:hypothetical protein
MIVVFWNVAPCSLVKVKQNNQRVIFRFYSDGIKTLLDSWTNLLDEHGDYIGKIL